MQPTGVADRAPEHIAQIIYLDAFVPEDGQALGDFWPRQSASGEWNASRPATAGDLPPSDGAKGKLGIADLKEGNHAAEEAFG